MEIANETTLQNIPTLNAPPGFGDDSASEPSFVEALIDPVNIFAHPRQVLDHPRFTDEEKRTVLLSWARDALVVEQVTSRLAPELRIRSRIDAVLAVLAAFDEGAAAEFASAARAIRAQRAESSNGSAVTDSGRAP
jgi:hypothetical protein